MSIHHPATPRALPGFPLPRESPCARSRALRRLPDASGPDGNFKLHQGETGTFPIYFAIPADGTGLVHFHASVLNLAGIARPDITVRLLHPVAKSRPLSSRHAQEIAPSVSNVPMPLLTTVRVPGPAWRHHMWA